jgi:hypothetical protein
MAQAMDQEAVEGAMDGASDGRSDSWYKRWITKQSMKLASDGSGSSRRNMQAMDQGAFD